MNDIPAPWLRPDVPDEQKTAAELCREWRLVDIKLKYDLARFASDTVDATADDALIDAAQARMLEIEQELTSERELDTLDDLQGVLGIALRIVKEGGCRDDRDVDMLGAVHAGISHVRNALARSASA